jgi:putative ABC transport system permease protein
MHAFWLTTIVPITLMAIINVIAIYTKLRLSPLKFIRRDLSKKKNKKVKSLKPTIPFIRRFRIRVIFQNMKTYIVIFVGVLLVNILLSAGLVFPRDCQDSIKNATDGMVSKNIHTLQIPYEALRNPEEMMKFAEGTRTKNKKAEKFSSYELKTTKDDVGREEKVSVYGINKNSKYVNVNFDNEENSVYISKAYSQKFGIKKMIRLD